MPFLRHADAALDDAHVTFFSLMPLPLDYASFRLPSYALRYATPLMPLRHAMPLYITISLGYDIK